MSIDRDLLQRLLDLHATAVLTPREGHAADTRTLNTLIAETEKRQRDRPTVVTLCGSSKFVDLFAVLAWWLERDEGKIVHSLHLLPYWYGDIPDHLAEVEGVADKLDALHLRKIEQSDEVFVVNWDGYIGTSTQREIRYALTRGIPVRWLAVPPEEFQGTPGQVDIALGSRLAQHVAAAKARQAADG